MEESIKFRTGLFINNTLTHKKEEFIPIQGKTVKWYICGPTVYDSSHLGHARAYVTFDYMRRIMEQYFGYDVRFATNITDIDDKIIQRSNELKEDFSTFARRWELDYLEDMAKLNIKPATQFTRVSENIPEIIKFIQKIKDNGFAYEVNSSVYFDIEKYKAAGHLYGKLEPNASKSLELLEEGEGALSKGVETEKKCKADFALWKKSKEGEPKWESPWGMGRPGWHIECSTVIDVDFAKAPIDMHSGGIDLKFPHHENEIAQSEAFYNTKDWCRVFLHTGHLEIDGKKMSKSLKNFTTIKEILKHYEGVHLRYLFLLHRWDTTFNYVTSALEEAVAKHKQFSEFLLNYQVIQRSTGINRLQKFITKDFDLENALSDSKEKIHAALCDNFDTPKTLDLLSALVIKANAYMSNNTDIKVHLLQSVASYVEHILDSFGCILPLKQQDSELTSALLNVICEFRTQVKANAADKAALFKLCDQIRDTTLPEVGVRIEDTGKSCIWKIVGKEEAKKAVEEPKKDKAKAVKEVVLAAEFFLRQTEKYSKFDTDGVPTHDIKGKELSEEQRNGLKKKMKSLKEKEAKKKSS